MNDPVNSPCRCHDATPTNPATIPIGINLDEIHRANTRRHQPYEYIVYPPDLPIRHTDCSRIIRSAGLPLPPKSACRFCHRLTTWQEMRREQPALFAEACYLETTINERRAHLGKDPVYLTRCNAPLANVTPEAETLSFDDGDGTCDSGWCFT